MTQPIFTARLASNGTWAVFRRDCYMPWDEAIRQHRYFIQRAEQDGDRYCRGWALELERAFQEIERNESYENTNV